MERKKNVKMFEFIKINLLQSTFYFCNDLGIAKDVFKKKGHF